MRNVMQRVNWRPVINKSGHMTGKGAQTFRPMPVFNNYIGSSNGLMARNASGVRCFANGTVPREFDTDIETDDDDFFEHETLKRAQEAKQQLKSSQSDRSKDLENVDRLQSDELKEFYDGRQQLACTTSRLRYRDLSDETIHSLCVAKDFSAIKERLIRSIMQADGKSRLDAKITAFEMYQHNTKHNIFHSFPHILGFAIAVAAGVFSIPMVFDKNLAIWFNERYVTTDIPPPEDLETPLEVSIWSWSWMEPVIGIASFLLLTAQFGRAQMVKMNWLPWTERVLQRRSLSLRRQFPKYPAPIVRDFSYACPISPKMPTFAPTGPASYTRSSKLA